MKFIIRNDDVAYDTSIEEIKKFCEICDKYGFPILHAITSKGIVQKIKSARMRNETIRSLSDAWFTENEEVCDYLRSRNDLIGVHGLFHTHEPTDLEVEYAKSYLKGAGFNPTYFIPPFNEGDYGEEFCGLTVSKLSADKGERLEDFIHEGTPTAPIMYLHSWRFDNKWYKFKHLEKCLKRLQ